MNETRFNGMGKLYAQYRPSYPREFINYLFSEIGMSKDSSIADIGAGTGILTRLLLEKSVYSVFAVEPNADMRAAAEESLCCLRGFVSVNGTAENTTLPAHSVDFVTAAQAFHWFDRQKFRAECERILKPGGKVILVWNARDAASEFVRENDEVNSKFCPNYRRFSDGLDRGENDDAFDEFFNGEYEAKVFRNDIPFADEAAFIGRNLSGSYAPKENDENYEPFVTALSELFKKYAEGGRLAMPNVTRSYAGSI